MSIEAARGFADALQTPVLSSDVANIHRSTMNTYQAGGKHGVAAAQEIIERQNTAIKVLRNALGYITECSAPLSSQQCECWPVMDRALKDTEEFK